MKTIIYIGKKFYFESGTMMSSVYTEGGLRYDWGLLQLDLEAGETITIRQASHAEREYYEGKLAQYRKQS